MPLPPFVFIAVFIRKGVKWWYTLAAKAQDDLNERGCISHPSTPL